jgi:hypothetical protein
VLSAWFKWSTSLHDWNVPIIKGFNDPANFYSESSPNLVTLFF